MKNVLIATDFSANAKHAALYGYRLAQRLKANVTLCNAFLVPSEMPEAGMVAWPLYEYDELVEENANMLNKLKAEMERSVDSEVFKPFVHCRSEMGPVISVLTDVVASENIKLTVMGTHGNNGLSEFVIGNHSRRMINDTTVPLLLVPAHAKMGSIKKIAFATDFKQPAKDLDSIYDLIALIRPLNAELLITHIQDDKEANPELKKQIDAFMTEISNKADYPAMYYRVVKDNKVENGLEWVYEHGHIDILAMVHRKHNFLERLVPGSFTQKVAREITIPLLVIPAKD
ncbi:MAG: universal stress protein [Mucilaginibacter sp.]